MSSNLAVTGPGRRRAACFRVAALLILVAVGCGGDDDAPAMRHFAPGVYEIRIRFFHLPDTRGCFLEETISRVDTLCVPEDILRVAGVEPCATRISEESGDFECDGSGLWRQCAVDFHFEGSYDVTDPQNLVMAGRWGVVSGETEGLCAVDCQSSFSFEARWKSVGGCRPGSGGGE